MAKSGALNGKLVVLMGGSGFIGNYVAQALLERGARVPEKQRLRVLVVDEMRLWVPVGVFSALRYGV